MSSVSPASRFITARSSSAGLSSLAPAQTREAKRENTLWQSCPPFYSGAFTIGTMVGQVNVSIQHVSRGILSTGCAHRCDGWNAGNIPPEKQKTKKKNPKHRKRFSLSLSFYYSDTIIRGIWLWVKVRKRGVVCRVWSGEKKKKKNRKKRQRLTPKIDKNCLIYSARVSAVI